MAINQIAQIGQNLIMLLAIFAYGYLMFNAMKDTRLKKKIKDAWDKIKPEREK